MIRIDIKDRDIFVKEVMINWCIGKIGSTTATGNDPVSEDAPWTYGKERDGFINGPFEVEYIDFFRQEDATAFKLRFK